MLNITYLFLKFRLPMNFGQIDERDNSEPTQWSQ